MATAGLPLPLRNALATLTIAALDDEAAAGALRWLVDPAGEPPADAARHLADVHLVDPGGVVLLEVHATHASAAAAHAARALRAAAAYRDAPASSDPPVETAIRRAAALWRERLFFEVHEVLEAVWKTASGDTRQALQGVIQIAVAYHHLGHGNARGGRTLMAEGRARLAHVAPDVLPPLDIGALLDATAECAAALASHRPAPPGHPLLALDG